MRRAEQSKFGIGDRVRILNFNISSGADKYIGQLADVIGFGNETESYGQIYLIKFFDGQQYGVVSAEIEIATPIMRRTIEDGSLVKVIAGPELYQDSDDIAKELLGDSKEPWNPKYIPKMGEKGDVLGIKDGYVLVKFDKNIVLMDISSLESETRKEEVKYLAIFPNKSIEEYKTEKEMEDRMQELYKGQSIKPGDGIKVYNVDGYREVKLKIEVSFM